jgi:hypothetical protein
MTMRDLRDLSKEDILAAMGLAPKPTTTSWLLGTLGVFGLGILVGAGTALLLAPKPGRELRRTITDRLATTARQVSPNGGPTLEGA